MEQQKNARFSMASCLFILAAMTSATILTMVLVPVLYATLYQIPSPHPKEPTPDLPANISDLESYLQSEETPTH